jgi:FkbM family methyltransferase
MKENSMKDFTQYGEMSLIDTFFGQKNGFFIDIGAADGIKNSNTRHLALRGWRGVFVEPCKHFLNPLKSLYSGNENFDIFEGAVCDFEGKTDFYVYESHHDSQISTISLEQKTGIENGGWFKGKFTETYEVDVITPASLISKFKIPSKVEFVDIDAEASDMKILQSWPWDSIDVELFCIEPSMGKENLLDFMRQKKYSNCFSSPGNMFFKKEEK